MILIAHQERSPDREKAPSKGPRIVSDCLQFGSLVVFLIGKMGNLGGWGHFFVDAANGVLLFGIHDEGVGEMD